MKIYTRTGDAGETSLYGGKRLSKADIRIHAYGSMDELQAVLGVASSLIHGVDLLSEIIYAIQKDTFVISCELARETKIKPDDPELCAERLVWLEECIDAAQAELPELRHFIVQGGCPLGAHLHLARAVCRRAEREIVQLAHQTEIRPLVLSYLNRLSDLLFTLARQANFQTGLTEQKA